MGPYGDGEIIVWATGNGSNINRNAPVQVGSDNKWVSVTAGGNYTIALKSDGTLWTWGNNYYGQLGDGTITDRNIPVQVGSDDKWISIAAGYGHTLALKSDRALWTWGYNGYGELGDGATTSQSIPARIGSENEWVMIAGGEHHTMALRSDGTLWAWGYNYYGQLGDGTNIDKNIPVQIGSDNKWVSVAAGYRHTLALKSDGTLWAWGANSNGQLGDGTNIDKNVPEQVVSDITPPTGSVVIDGGVTYTNTTSVTLTLSASDTESGVSQMCFSNDGSTWSSWEAYGTSKAWTLEPGIGTKTIYVQYQDSEGNVSESFSDTILLVSALVTPSEGTDRHRNYNHRFWVWHKKGQSPYRERSA